MSSNRKPSFWSLISNGEYIVGTTGQTVYVYDSNNTELAKFKDLKYAYTPVLSPKGDIFVVKSTDGRMAVYSLNDLTLIKKFRYSKVTSSQDDGLCFNADGNELYNIERHTYSYSSALSIYDTKDFSLKKRLFYEDRFTELCDIEYDTTSDTFYIIGFFRDKNSGVANERYIAKLVNDNLTDIIVISNKEFVNCTEYKNLLRFGESDFAKEFFITNPDIILSPEDNYSISMLYAMKSNDND